MKFRRSVKSEKHDSSKPTHIAIPQKDAIAIEPPKKVIKALYDWNGYEHGDIYLTFQTGDFLHVVSRENDSEWYEACNPLKNERGLVPVKFFENVGKTVRDSGGSNTSTGATHDSGYMEGPGKVAGGPAQSTTANGASSYAPGHRISKSMGKGAPGVYGVVAYDFHAERPDELDAKEGEAIIVIAQSNPEWFVAKPITRLGGPGLIPVSFIEIRDMTTGKAVADPLEAVQKAGIPRVEEWKKMAAEYKNTSIPLGSVSSSQQVQGLQQGMNRMSVNTTQQNGGGHSRHASTSTYHQQQNLPAPVRASVSRFTFADEKFHFIVECRMSNGAHWDLSRIYEDFYELQINLINAFPEEAGKMADKPRILPYMPGPVKFVTDNISEGRRSSLDEYLRDLLQLPQHITASPLVRNFFAPRPGDYEVDPSAVNLEEHARPAQPQDRYSQASYSSHQQQGPLSSQPTPQHNTSPVYGHQRQQQSMASTVSAQPASAQNHLRAQSETPQQALAPPSAQQNTHSSASSSGGNVKVKAWFDRDTCVVIRMSPRGQFNFEQLYQKIVERRRLEYPASVQPDELLEIEYRDEQDEEYYRLEGDEDLDVALARNDKLTLAVRKAEKVSDQLQAAGD